jgi:predicted dehydrogenase
MREERALTPEELGISGALPLPRRTDWRIGMVGFGNIARYHAAAYRQAGWRVVAVADPDPAARVRARELLGDVAIYTGYEQLVTDGDVEVIALLTQPTFREPVIAAAARAGKPILSEKPLSTDLALCERLVTLAEEAGIPLAVSQNYRWNPANFMARQLIAEGWIGRPFHAGIELYGRQDVILAGHPFYASYEDFLTVQWNTHLADLLRYWLGRDAQRVLAWTRRMNGQSLAGDGLLFSLADFGTGVTGHITHSELLRSSLGKTCARVDGEEGSIELDLYSSQLRFQSRRLGDEIFALASGTWPDSICGSMGDLLLAVEEGREPLVSARRNLATIRHVLAERESARAGGVWIDL